MGICTPCLNEVIVVTVCDNDKASSRARKLAKQRLVPVGTASAVQFSEKCLRQEGGGAKVDGEIIFQTPLPTADSTTNDFHISKGIEDDMLVEVQTCEPPLNEETSSFLNVAAPEFVPESAPAQLKDEENAVVSSNSDVSSSQTVHPHKYRHFNKQQPFHPYQMIPAEYAMIRGTIPSHLPIPYPYYLQQRSREPLIQFGIPFGYPYAPVHFQQSRMFSDGFPLRAPHVYAAGVPSDMYVMDLGGTYPQDVQNRLYSWSGVPEQSVRSPEPEGEVHDNLESRDSTQETISPNTNNVNDAMEARSHDHVASSEHSGDQFPATSSSSDSMSQFSTRIETNSEHLMGGGTGDSNISNIKNNFSEEVHPIKDNSTGQVVDTGYIHKQIDNSQNEESPSTEASKPSEEHDDSTKSDLELSSEKDEAMELSQESIPSDNVTQQDQNYCDVMTMVDMTTTVDICNKVKEPSENGQNIQTENAITEIIKAEPQPTITSISVDSGSKIVPEEKLAATSLPVVAKKVLNNTLGTKLNEPRTKPIAGEPQSQQHKVDRKYSSNNNNRTNQLSTSRENNYSRTDTQSSVSSGKMSSKVMNKSGASIILRTVSASEKKTYQQSSHTEHTHSSSRDMNHSSFSGTLAGPQTEAKKSHSNFSAHSSIRDTSHSSSATNGSTVSQAEVKKPHTVPAWGQAIKWSQVFDNSASSKDIASTSKDSVTQSDSVPSAGESVVDQTSRSPDPEHVNRQLKSLGGTKYK